MATGWHDTATTVELEYEECNFMEVYRFGAGSVPTWSSPGHRCYCTMFTEFGIHYHLRANIMPADPHSSIPTSVSQPAIKYAYSDSELLNRNGNNRVSQIREVESTDDDDSDDNDDDDDEPTDAQITAAMKDVSTSVGGFNALDVIASDADELAERFELAMATRGRSHIRGLFAAYDREESRQRYLGRDYRIWENDAEKMFATYGRQKFLYEYSSSVKLDSWERKLLDRINAEESLRASEAMCGVFHDGPICFAEDDTNADRRARHAKRVAAAIADLASEPLQVNLLRLPPPNPISGDTVNVDEEDNHQLSAQLAQSQFNAFPTRESLMSYISRVGPRALLRQQAEVTGEISRQNALAANHTSLHGTARRYEATPAEQNMPSLLLNGVRIGIELPTPPTSPGYSEDMSDSEQEALLVRLGQVFDDRMRHAWGPRPREEEPSQVIEREEADMSDQDGEGDDTDGRKDAGDVNSTPVNQPGKPADEDNHQNESPTSHDEDDSGDAQDTPQQNNNADDPSDDEGPSDSSSSSEEDDKDKEEDKDDDDSYSDDDDENGSNKGDDSAEKKNDDDDDEGPSNANVQDSRVAEPARSPPLSFPRGPSSYHSPGWSIQGSSSSRSAPRPTFAYFPARYDYEDLPDNEDAAHAPGQFTRLDAQVGRQLESPVSDHEFTDGEQLGMQSRLGQYTRRNAECGNHQLAHNRSSLLYNVHSSSSRAAGGPPYDRDANQNRNRVMLHPFVNSALPGYQGMSSSLASSPATAPVPVLPGTAASAGGSGCGGSSVAQGAAGGQRRSNVFTIVVGQQYADENSDEEEMRSHF